MTAPISGRVSRAQFTAGNIVTADVTPLTSVVSTDKVYAYFDADERVYLKYTQLARDGQRGQSTPVYLGLTNETGNPHLGQMNFVDNRSTRAPAPFVAARCSTTATAGSLPACMPA